VAALLLSSINGGCSEPPPAFVLYNGTVVVTANPLQTATAICVSKGRVAVVGADEDVLHSACAREAAGNAVNLEDAMVLPGLTDSHAHLFMEATRRTRADLSASMSANESAQVAMKFYKEHQDLVNASGGWLLGFGWDQTQWQSASFPTRHDLDTLFPDIPVYLEHISGHAGWANSKAIEVAGSDIPAAGDPPGGHVERDAAGKPTGIFSDDATLAITRHVPPLSDSAAHKALNEVFYDCASHGLTGMHDLDSQAHDIEIMQNLQAQGNLPLRVYAFRSGVNGNPGMAKVSTSDGLLTVKGVKFFSDGAMGSWSAALLAPYSDRPSTSGTLVYKTEELRGNVSEWANAGWQIAVHAIGDAANRQVLDVYEELLNAKGRGEDLRWRVEHSQILAPSDVSRFAQLGVIPSMQPSHCASDLTYADKRLGPKRAAGGYIWQGLLQSGVKVLPFGSDFPTAGTIPPLLGIHAAVSRQTPGGFPKGGWHPEQRVSMARAIQGYTSDSAHASFREAELGELREQFYADLTVLDRNIFSVSTDKLLDTAVLATIVGGKVTYMAKDEVLGGHDLKKLEGLRRASKAEAPSGIGARLHWWWRRYVKDTNEDMVLPDILL